MTEEIEIPTQFTHSVKLSETAKGLRIDVHVYANDQQVAVNQAFETYRYAQRVAKDDNIPLAPMEIEAKK